MDAATGAQVLEAAWPILSRARHDHDVATLQSIETGAARDAAIYVCTSGCKPPPVTPLAARYYSGPPQTSYPASFLAEVEHPGGDGAREVEEIVFTRKDASSPWLIAIDVLYQGGDPMLGPKSSPDFTSPVPQMAGVDVSGLPNQLAQYWQSWKDTGAPPAVSPFTTSGSLLDIGNAIAASRKPLADRGITDQTVYRVDRDNDGVYQFAAPSQTVAVCFAVRWSSTMTQTRSDQPIPQEADQHEFGPLVAPGNYSKVVLNGARQSCIRAFPAGRGVDVHGQTGGNFSADATPA